MDIVFVRKCRFLAFFGFGIVLLMQAALITTIYEHVKAIAPRILLGHNTTWFITVVLIVLSSLAVTMNWLMGLSHPQEAGVGKRVAAGASIVSYATLIAITVAMLKEWELLPVFLIGVGGFVIVFLVIMLDDTEARRLELEAHTAGTRRLNNVSPN